MAGFLGMRGNGDWITNQRPENWRQMMLYLYPNGTAPLTAIMSMLSSESTDDPTYHWWTKGLPTQGGDTTGVYTDAALSILAADATIFASGVTLYLRMAEALADQFREGHQVMLQNGGDFNYDYNAKVTDVVKNGASSYVAAKLLETTQATYAVSSTANILIVGNVNPEGATMPNAIAYDPTEFFNYTQIFRTPLSITRTARRTRLRTGDGYKEAKREALELHAIEMEKAFIFGERSSNTGANGMPERTTRGVRKWILNEAAANVSDFVVSGTTPWTTGGGTWLNAQLEVIFRHGRKEKLGLIGSGGLLGIQVLAEQGATINIMPGQTDYGLQVMKWMTPFGVINLMTHPLFSDNAALRNDMLILEPQNLRYRYIDDTFFVEDPQDRRNRNNSRDGTEEEYITEAGLELHHPSTMGYLTGLNQNV